MDKQNKMGVMPIPKLVMNMSIPLMFSLLIQSLYNIVDSIFVSKLGEKYLSATSLAYPMQLLMVSVGVGTAVGINALLSRLVGAKKYDRANRVATTGLILTLISIACFMLIGIFFAGTFINLFTDDKELASLATTYLAICMIFCQGSLLQMFGQRLLQAVGDTFYSMCSLCTGAITNIILDPIMIFGLLGFPKLGITGAAIATVIGQWMGAIVALGLNYLKNKEIHFEIKGFKMEKENVYAIYKVGLPTIITQAMGSLMVSSVNKILISYSDTAVAFYGVYYKLQSFLFMPMNGLGQAAIPIVGFNYGAKRPDRIKQVLKTALPVGVGIALLATFVFMIFPGNLLGLFSASDTMKSIGVPALRIISITFALSTVTMILGYCASGLGNGMINMVGTTLRQFIILVPLTYVFTSSFGLSGAWYAIWISEAIAVLYAIFRFRQVYTRKLKQIKNIS